MGYLPILWRSYCPLSGFDHFYVLFRFCQRRFQYRDHLVDLPLSDDEGRKDTDNVRSRVDEDQTVIHSVSDHALHRSSADQALHEASSPSLQAEIIFCHKFVKFLLQIGGGLLHVIRYSQRLILVEHSVDSSARERPQPSALAEVMISGLMPNFCQAYI